jgi:hypothetical protein
VLPIGELKLLLLNFGAYESASGALGFIANHMQTAKRYLQHRRLTPMEKQRLFPTVGGYRDAVHLTSIGQERLDQIDRGVEKMFENMTSDVPAATLRSFLGLLAPFADQAVNRLEFMIEEQKNEKQ